MVAWRPLAKSCKQRPRACEEAVRRSVLYLNAHGFSECRACARITGLRPLPDRPPHGSRMLRVMIGIEAYMQASSSAFVIRMYLPEGVPEGIRIVERSNWVGQAVICPHSRFTSVRERPEAESAGVYVLLGQEEEN